MKSTFVLELAELSWTNVMNVAPLKEWLVSIAGGFRCPTRLGRVEKLPEATFARPLQSAASSQIMGSPCEVLTLDTVFDTCYQWTASVE